MKAISQAVMATVLAVSATAASSATMGPENIIVNILNGDTGNSMLIDTNISANSLGAPWVSAPDLTNAISAFLGGTTNASFWVAGRDDAGFDKYAYTTQSFTDATVVNAFVNSNLSNFIAAANNAASDWALSSVAGTSEDWLADIAPGTAISYLEPQVLGSGLVTEVPLNIEAQFFSSQTGFFLGTKLQDLDFWRLDANGELSYNASVIPVPAAVWLMGSGLLGLVGIARRRKA